MALLQPITPPARNRLVARHAVRYANMKAEYDFSGAKRGAFLSSQGTLMKETMLDAEVTYTLEHAGRFYIIERVPARVCQETGEQFFSPEAVEHIQSLIKSKPDRVIETPVYQYT